MMFDSMNFCVRAFEDDVGHTKADVRVGHTKADVRAGSSEQQRNGEPRSQLCGVVGSCGIGSNLCAGNKRGAATAAIMGIANMNLGMSFVINSGDAGAGDAGEWRRGRGRRGRTPAQEAEPRVGCFTRAEAIVELEMLAKDTEINTEKNHPPFPLLHAQECSHMKSF
jgi:hypothetical protein